MRPGQIETRALGRPVPTGAGQASRLHLQAHTRLDRLPEVATFRTDAADRVAGGIAHQDLVVRRAAATDETAAVVDAHAQFRIGTRIDRRAGRRADWAGRRCCPGRWRSGPGTTLPLALAAVR